MNRKATPAMASRLLLACSATLASLVFAAAVAPPGAVAAPARPAATGMSYTLSGTASFKSGGHTWQLLVSVEGGRIGSLLGSTSARLQFSTSHLGGTETDSWSAVNISPSAFTLGAGNSATVDTGTDLSPIAALTLTFSSKSHAKADCASGSGTVYSGKMSGSVSLAAGRDLTLSGRKVTFSKPTLEIEHACLAPTPCPLSSWAGSGATAFPPPSPLVVAGGFTAGRPGHPQEITSVGGVYKATELTSLVGVTRGAGGSVTNAVPKYRASSKTLTVSGSRSGLVTGRAVIDHVRLEGHRRFTCTVAGRKYTATESQYAGTFASTTTFEARTLLAGTIKTASHGIGTFTFVTLKRK
jgi:hypothetical protein